MDKEDVYGLLRKGKTMILAYDQGFEHGPSDFNEHNVNPKYIFDIALEGRYSALAVQAGVAEKYHKKYYRDIPLIIKLNAKTKFMDGDPVSLQHTSVAYARSLGAIGVGYTIYLGSKYEQKMFKEFGKIVEEAHEHGMAVVLWMYPRGLKVENEIANDVIAYGARIAMELGADIVKVKFNGDLEGMRWTVKSAAATRVVIAGGNKTDELSFLKTVEKALQAGITGIAVGRNVWQSDRPIDFSRALNEVIFDGVGAEEAFSRMRK